MRLRKTALVMALSRPGLTAVFQLSFNGFAF